MNSGMNHHTDDDCYVSVAQICDLARDIAKQSGLKLSKAEIDDNQPLVCRDYHLLQMSARDKTVVVKLHHDEIRKPCELTEGKIRSAVSRLQLMLEI